MNEPKSRKAALKAAYKLSPPPAGIMAIRHIASGKSWIEASRDPAGLVNRYRFELNLGSHRNAGLQADWRRDGAAAFNCAVLETLEPSSAPDYDQDAALDAALARWLPDCARGAANSYL